MIKEFRLKAKKIAEYSFTETSTSGTGMLCYQTAAKGEPILEDLKNVTSDNWDASTGNMTDQKCNERDDKYMGATDAKAVLRAAGLPWQATPGNPTWSISQWYKSS